MTSNVELPSSPYHRQVDSQTQNADETQRINTTINNSSNVPRRQVSNVAKPTTQSGLFGASSNMVNSIVGSGIIGLPFAISSSGLVVGVGILILVSYMTDKSLRMLVELAGFHPKLRHLGVNTYEDLARIPFGEYGAGMVMAGMFVLAYGAMVSYLIVIKDSVPTILGLSEAGEGNFSQAELPMIITSLVIVLPLSMMQDMASLEKTSLFSVIADVVLVGFIVLYSPVQSTVSENGGFVQVLQDNWINGKLFIGLGVLSTAMACQHSAFIVSNSLVNKTPERWSIVTYHSIGVAAILCLLLGVFGYLGFLQETQGDILNNFDSDSVITNVGRGLLAITMFFTYPMEAFVARHVIAALFYKGDIEGNELEPKLFGFFGRRHKITLALYIFTLIPALLVDDLGPVLSLTGAIGASFIAYICTGAVYLGINGCEFLQHCTELLGRYPPGKTCESQAENALSIIVDTSETTEQLYQEISAGWKPLWWYVCGFPLWTALAAKGAVGTSSFIYDFTGTEEIVATDCDDLEVGPRKNDYYISIFMISFGLLATVVGVASNIYVELM